MPCAASPGVYEVLPGKETTWSREMCREKETSSPCGHTLPKTSDQYMCVPRVPAGQAHTYDPISAGAACLELLFSDAGVQ